MMRATLAIIMAGLVLMQLPSGLAGGMPAHAQGYGPPGTYSANPGPYAPYDAPPTTGTASGPVDAQAATRMLAGRGFSNISVIRKRGAIILLEANGPRGERVQVVVDGTSGAIAGMKVIGFGDKRY